MSQGIRHWAALLMLIPSKGRHNATYAAYINFVSAPYGVKLSFCVFKHILPPPDFMLLCYVFEGNNTVHL